MCEEKLKGGRGGVIRAGAGKFEGSREEVRAYRGGGRMQGPLPWNAACSTLLLLRKALENGKSLASFLTKP